MEKYEIKRHIGKGSDSIVFEGINLITKEPVAIKEIIIKDNNENINNEIKIIKKLKHKNILSFVDIIFHKNKVYIISELCDYPLSKIISNLSSENAIRYIFQQLASGFEYLYKEKIIHRDIKPDNILISNFEIK